MSSLVKRNAYVCIQCQGVYLDSPVTECDCQHGADIFWRAKVSYRKLDSRAITFAEFTAAQKIAERLAGEGE